ncbi:MAG: sigma-70 family RNA polymerase sigma factor [Ruminococcus sp.]|jgi:RNA polymerase sporulation-specific sigma factor|uniref:sigma-70 family RNA polymerase sigma factor n=1 Tax=uncultured Ruminococcus sp. TaxID=165186 RepID=UPI00262AE5EB|nr:sigma-70 family RNA polymerase sigma factor [uncultured Ruminococcus sp.]
MPHEIAAPLAEENLGLVHLCANRFRGRGVEYEELYSAGCVGLLKAVRAFDSSRGVQFSTYAVPVILGEIKRVFRDGGAIHVSRGLRERAMRLQKLQEMFEQTHGRTPTLSELSVLADCTVEACAQALCVSQAPLSLTQQSDGDGEQDGQLDIPVEAPDRRIGDLLSLRQEMEQLAPRDRMLLELRYFRELTQTKTAQILGMTQVQVSRREKKLLSQLREALK